MTQRETWALRSALSVFAAIILAALALFGGGVATGVAITTTLETGKNIQTKSTQAGSNSLCDTGASPYLLGDTESFMLNRFSRRLDSIYKEETTKGDNYIFYSTNSTAKDLYFYRDCTNINKEKAYIPLKECSIIAAGGDLLSGQVQITNAGSDWDQTCKDVKNQICSIDNKFTTCQTTWKCCKFWAGIYIKKQC